jgi:hypothetical protein
MEVTSPFPSHQGRLYSMNRAKSFAILTLLFVLISQTANAQIAYKKGENVVFASLGLGGVSGLYGTVKVPPIGVGFDYGFNENISLGGLLAYSSSEIRYGWFGGNWGWDYSYFIIGGRGAYHLDVLKNKQIDTYGGVMLGYNIVSFKEVGTVSTGAASSGSSYVVFGLFAGGRYYFNPNLAAHVELGFGVGNLTLGISYKLP